MGRKCFDTVVMYDITNRVWPTHILQMKYENRIGLHFKSRPSPVPLHGCGYAKLVLGIFQSLVAFADRRG